MEFGSPLIRFLSRYCHYYQTQGSLANCKIVWPIQIKFVSEPIGLQFKRDISDFLFHEELYANHSTITYGVGVSIELDNDQRINVFSMVCISYQKINSKYLSIWITNPMDLMQLIINWLSVQNKLWLGNVISRDTVCSKGLEKCAWSGRRFPYD